MRSATAVALMLGAALPALAQQSAHFTLEEHVLNAGGRPADGSILASTSFRVTLDSIGDAIVAPGLASASFHAGSGFAQAYPPPGEVTGLRFADLQTLEWDPDGSGGGYNLYRDEVGNLSALAFGICAEQDIPIETTNASAVPAPGVAWFHLVTALNLLGEEGTKGFQSNGSERQGSVCP